ncbi:MAG: hypothetical protein GF307_05910 [candidate division Zixibacteria bacterium]|nr:hypothetical protein [candidate division Zixibacteria bacterium]
MVDTLSLGSLRSRFNNKTLALIFIFQILLISLFIYKPLILSLIVFLIGLFGVSLAAPRKYIYFFFYLIIFFSYFQNSPSEEVLIYRLTFYKMNILDLLFGFFFFVVFFRMAVLGENDLKLKAKINKPLLLLLLSILFASFYGIAFFGASPLNTIADIRPFVYLFASYLVAAMLIDDEKDIKRILLYVLVLLGLRAIHGLILMNTDPLRARLDGPFTFYSQEIIFFIFFVCMAFALFIEKTGAKSFKRAVYLFLPFVILAIVYSYRRYAYVGIAFAAATIPFLIPFSRIKEIISKYRYAFIVSFIILFALLPSILSSNFGSRLMSIGDIKINLADVQGAESSNFYRIWESYNGLLELINHPILGIGWGSEWPVFIPWPLSEEPFIPPRSSHNTWLGFWLKGGLPTFLCGLALFMLLFWRATPAKLIRISDEQVLITRAIAMFAAAMGLASFFAMHIYHYRFPIFLGLLIAVSDYYSTAINKLTYESKR